VVVRTGLRQSVIWLLGWAGIVVVGALIMVRFDIAQRREAFQTNARIAHGVLSQRAVQHEAILATLVLLNPGGRSELRLPALYPQVLAALRRDDGNSWPDPALQAAEDRSREAHRAALGPIDTATGQYTLVLAGEPSSFALRIDVQRMMAFEQWPLARTGPIRATLEYTGNTIVLEPGKPVEAQPAGLTAGFVFVKPLAAASQPFELRLSRATGPAEWPWAWLLTWTVFASFALAALAAWLRGRRERRRAEELLRVGQVARLNTLGELAGGIAHELNQPLAAVLASTQAAQRLLDDDPPALNTARQAMSQAATQGRRAADVVARLRRLVETPNPAHARRPVHLDAALRNVLDLLGPETRRRGIDTAVQGQEPVVLADPVALEQIVHNLLGNAMQALEEVPAGERRLVLHIQEENGQGVLTVRDNGPGIAPEALQHVFEPFYTTRRGGLGLGLSLCETLAHAMNGTLTARNAEPRGAEFRLTLPMVKAPA
jgi:signal transduction histidine kinase